MRFAVVEHIDMPVVDKQVVQVVQVEPVAH
jgi:hypothetical protein